MPSVLSKNNTPKSVLGNISLFFKLILIKRTL